MSAVKNPNWWGIARLSVKMLDGALAYLDDYRMHSSIRSAEDWGRVIAQFLLEVAHCRPIERKDDERST